MALLPTPHVLIWLADYPNELAYYQSGEAPFNLTCFSQASLNDLNQLLDQLAHNDEYQRVGKLHYANQRRAARNVA